MSRYLFFAGCLLSILVPGYSELTLVENGKSDYRIYVDAFAIAPEKQAAVQLQLYLEKSTGCKLDIVDKLPDKLSKIIFVGPSPYFQETLKDVKWETLGHDGIVLKTVGSNVFLVGGRTRGTLYAVYTFLQDIVGCRWWTSTETYIPKHDTLKISELDKVYVPQFIYREAFYKDIIHSPEFQIALKLNGYFQNTPQQWGGHYRILGWCHTFYKLLPPEKYFKAHPEWYSLINGKRTADYPSQLCLTNSEMRREMVKNALALIAENPDAGIISISQNDSVEGGRCECTNCKKIEEQEGTPSGLLLHFMNEIAAEIEKEYPGTLVETLAYNYTRQPPRYVKPAQNVLIRLCCGIGCFYDKPLDDNLNESFRQYLYAWSQKTNKIFIWDYVTNFSNYLVPHPNLRVLGPNLRFFAKHHVVGVFNQGDSHSTVGDFIRLRLWLQGQLLWNPFQDDDKLINEFLDGYYGEAGKYLKEYLNLVHDAFVASDIRLSSSGSNLGYMTLEQMNQASELFNKAQAAVKNNPTLLDRVSRESIPLDHLWIIRYSDLKDFAGRTGKEFLGPENIVKFSEDWIAKCKKYGLTQYSEGMTFDKYIPRLRAMVKAATADETASVPVECKKMKKADWVDVQDLRFNLPAAATTEDKFASDGSAAVMSGGHGDWGIQYPLSSDLLRIWPGLWKCYVVLKVKPKKDAKIPMPSAQIGIYDSRRNTDICKRIFISKSAACKYETVLLGQFKLNPNCYFWIAPVPSAHVEKIFVDRIFLIPSKASN